MTAHTSRVHCAESGEESMETESVYSLKCHISQDVNHLHEGLKHVSNVSATCICFRHEKIINVSKIVNVII
jgi:hypothetical protein